MLLLVLSCVDFLVCFVLFCLSFTTFFFCFLFSAHESSDDQYFCCRSVFLLVTPLGQSQTATSPRWGPFAWVCGDVPHVRCVRVRACICVCVSNNIYGELCLALGPRGIWTKPRMCCLFVCLIFFVSTISGRSPDTTTTMHLHFRLRSRRFLLLISFVFLLVGGWGLGTCCCGPARDRVENGIRTNPRTSKTSANSLPTSRTTTWRTWPCSGCVLPLSSLASASSSQRYVGDSLSHEAIANTCPWSRTYVRPGTVWIKRYAAAATAAAEFLSNSKSRHG